MQNFIVLGMVPGTDVQFSFQQWLLFCAGVIFVSTLFGLRRAIQTHLLSWYAARLINRSDFTKLPASDQTLLN